MTNQETVSSRRVPTGIAGLDEIMEGGLPRHGVTLVIGDAGTGKTTFGLQVLATAADVSHELGIFVAFEEDGEHILANAATFTWGGDTLASRISILDSQLSQSVELGGDFDLVGFLAILGERVAAVGARKIVFDGIDVLLGYLCDPLLIRREMFRLRDWIYASRVSAIVTVKASMGQAYAAEDYEFLQFMADCVIALCQRVVEGTAQRTIRVVKYRGTEHSANELPLTISRAGLEVAEHTTQERGYAASNERVSTGVSRLDAMLSGGYYRGSSVLITGAPGTAKTSLSTAFAEAAVRRGERVLYISFDEAPEQIIRNMSSIGIELGEHVASGALRIHSLRARSQSPEGHAGRIRQLLRETSARHLIIDPLSAMSQPGAETEAEGAALQLLDYAKRLGVTAIGTSLLGATPMTESSPLEVSTIADTWMHVSYAIQNAERNRALTVVKSRGTAHSNQVRELILTSDGVTLTDVYAVGGEVLMGNLRWEKENEARRLRANAAGAAALREQRAELALASTKSELQNLARKLAIQETELADLQAEEVADLEVRNDEDEEILRRRSADPSALSPTPTSITITGRVA